MLRLRARVKLPMVSVHTVTGEKIETESIGVLVVKTEKSTVLGTKTFWDIILEDGRLIKDVPTENVRECPWAKSVATDEATESVEETNKESEGDVATNG